MAIKENVDSFFDTRALPPGHPLAKRPLDQLVMARLLDGGLQEEVADMIFGNGFDHTNWQESLSMADQIITVVTGRLIGTCKDS